MQPVSPSIIEKYRLYWGFPLLGVAMTLIMVNQNLGCLLCDGVDIRTFYYGIQTSLFDPENTFNHAYYLERGAWYYVYLPFFALLFYPLTIWGLAIFEILFVGLGLMLFLIALGLFDRIMEAKGVSWPCRTYYLVIMTIGTHFQFHFFYGQSKFYVVFLVALILYGDHQQWSPGWIHLCFLCLLTIMTHFLFVYAFYVIHQIKSGKPLFITPQWVESALKRPNKDQNRNKRPVSPEKRIDIPQTLRILLFVVTIFIVGNLLFLVHPVLISGYLTEILYGFIFHPEVVLYRYTNATLPYFLYTYGEIGPIYPLILVGIYVGFLFYGVSKSLNLLDVFAGYCCLYLLLNYLNEPHYFVFFFPILLLWTSSPFHPNTSHQRYFEIWSIIAISGIMVIHQSIPDFVRAVFYGILIIILLFRRLMRSTSVRMNRH